MSPDSEVVSIVLVNLGGSQLHCRLLTEPVVFPQPNQPKTHCSHASMSEKGDGGIRIFEKGRRRIVGWGQAFAHDGYYRIAI